MSRQAVESLALFDSLECLNGAFAPMSVTRMRALGAGYTSEVDTVDEQKWYGLLQEFDDANIYQTWSYATVICGRRNASHLILKRNGEVAAIAQARIAKLPILNLGVAYIHWGPLWRRHAREIDVETLRQALRALRNEFVCTRGLVLRVFPALFASDSDSFSTLLAEEMFLPLREPPSRTVLMDITPTLERIREGMKSHWKRELKVAERNGLEILEGTGQELFDAFVDMYREMVARKRFVEPNDINQFKWIQAQLPERLKMKIMLGAAGGAVCAGLICSAIGDTAIYLFGATSNGGMKSRGSYLLHWKLIEKLKRNGTSVYDLNGINPTRNPGTFKFKTDLAGVNSNDVYFLGRFDSHANLLKYVCVRCVDRLRTRHRSLRTPLTTMRRLVSAEPKKREFEL